MFWEKLKTAFSNRTTRSLVSIPIYCGLFLLIILVVTSKGNYSGNLLQNILISLAFFCWGFSGLPIIIRRESPEIITTKGWLAVVQGIIVVIIFWGLVIYRKRA
jgi:hypothetical protein